jgi:hypothetical protein
MSEHEHESQELDFTPVEGDRPIPLGWRILWWGLVAFGAFYLVAFSPWATGWTQVAGLSESAPGSGGNVAATVLFTAAAAIAAGAILLAAARKRK